MKLRSLLPLAPVLALIAFCVLTALAAGDLSIAMPAMGVVVTAGLSPKVLMEKRGQLLAQGREILDKAHKENRDLTAEEDAKWSEMIKDADEYKRVADEQYTQAQAIANRRQQQERAEAEGRELNRYGLDPQNSGGSGAPPEPRGGGAPTAQDCDVAIEGWFINQASRSDLALTQEHRDAANRVGLRLDARELVINLGRDYQTIKNSLKTTSGPAGGYLRGESFMTAFEQALLWFGGILNVADVIRTSSAEPIHWPTGNDTSNTGRQIGEEKAVSTVDPSFAKTLLYAYKFTSDEVLVSFELLRDSQINLAAVIGAMLGERLGRVINTKCTTGSGAGTPEGIVTASALGKETASATAITADELLDLQYSVDKAYRDQPGVGWMMHDATAKAIRKLKADERYHWVDGMNAMEPSMLFGKPVQINNDMADTLEAAAKSVLYGQFKSYKVRQVGNVRSYRLMERHRENDQDAFLAFTEVDGKLLDAGGNPIKHLLQNDGA